MLEIAISCVSSSTHVQVKPYLQRSCTQHSGSFIFGHIWRRRAFLVGYLLVAVVRRFLGTRACITINHLSAARRFLLIFIGLIDIWLFWGRRFWGCFFKLFWFVVKLFSIIWSEAV